MTEPRGDAPPSPQPLAPWASDRLEPTRVARSAAHAPSASQARGLRTRFRQHDRAVLVVPPVPTASQSNSTGSTQGQDAAVGSAATLTSELSNRSTRRRTPMIDSSSRRPSFRSGFTARLCHGAVPDLGRAVGDDGDDGLCQPGAWRVRDGGRLCHDRPDAAARRAVAAGAGRGRGRGGARQPADRAALVPPPLRRRRARPGAADDGARLHLRPGGALSARPGAAAARTPARAQSRPQPRLCCGSGL